MERYSYRKVLGAGNYGRAWLVRSRGSNRSYVIKEVNVALMSERERDQAVNEVAILSQLKHVNVIRYREAFVAQAGAVLGIVMEYAHRGDLAQVINDTRRTGPGVMLSSSRIMGWFVQLCFAIQYIHSEKILHRDLKPSNLFLSLDGLVKVGDFGISKVLGNTLDHASTTIGTPYYLSPEICQRRPYNQKSDMWAAGCILYELATLNHPFDGPDFSTLVFRILHGVYTPIARTFGPLIEDTIAALLSSNPVLRPSARSILTSPNFRPYVKAYTDQGERAADTPTAESPVAARTRTKTSAMLRTNHISSLYAKSPLPSCSQTSGKRARKERSSECLRPKSSEKISESPWVKREIVLPQTERRMTLRSRIIHGHSASEPVPNTKQPTLANLQPGHTFRTRTSGQCNFTDDQKSPDDLRAYGIVESTRRSSRVNSEKATRRMSLDTIERRPSASTKPMRKRKSCIPVFETTTDIPSSPAYQPIAKGEPSTNKRRRSLQDLVKDSVFLSKLVSSDRWTTSSKTSPRVSKLVLSDMNASPRVYKIVSSDRKTSLRVSKIVSSDMKTSPRVSKLVASDMKTSPRVSNIVSSNRKTSPRVSKLAASNTKTLPRVSKPIASDKKSSPRVSHIVLSDRMSSSKTPPRVSPSASSTKRTQRQRRKGSQTPARVGLRSRHPRQRSEPYSRIRTSPRTASPLLRKKEPDSIPCKSVPTTRTSARTRKGSKAPKTCLFPSEPVRSSKPRTLIKHGTYSLNIPTVAEKSTESLTSQCERCGCKQRNISTINLVSSAATAENILDEQRNTDRDQAGVHPAETGDAPGASSSPRKRKHPDDSPSEQIGVFKRRYAIRRLGRDLKQSQQVQPPKGTIGRGKTATKSIRRQPKPDVVPCIDKDDHDQEVTHRGRVGNDRGICNEAFEHDEDFEVAKLLHAGMARHGEVTTELRGKLELLKMFLEKHVGAERTLLAYDIMSSASSEGKFGASAGSRGSDDVVRLVAEVIGPGKMKYFPILVQAFSLSGQCE